MSTSIEIGRVACVARGSYNSAVEYEALDIITHAGCSYMVTAACNGQEPPNAEYYMQLTSTGPTGPAGQQGVAGPQGPVGEQGPAGAKGDKGDKGDTGTGLQVKGTYATVAALEAAVTDPAVGDMYNVGASAPFNIYMWNGTVWENQGQLQGLQGEQGPAGTPGAQGAPGATGPAGPNEISTTTATAINGLIKGNGTNAAQAVSGTDYATPAQDITATLTTSWTGSSAPYTQTISGLTGVTASSKLDIGLAEDATDAQYTDAVGAQIRATDSGAGTVTFKAHGTKPTVELPIIVRVVS